MLTASEKHLIATRSDEWQGPNSWGWVDDYRLNLHQAILQPGFG
jgi:hypothetical protein